MAKQQPNEIEIQVATGAGNFPDEGFARFNVHQKLSHVLDKAKDELDLQNTSGWVARVGNRNLDPNLSLEDNGLSGFVQISWGPVEPGGGCA